MARVGVWLDEATVQRRHQFGLNVFEGYIGEVLQHLGISFNWIHKQSDVSVSAYDILIIALAEDHEAHANAIWEFAEAGGAVISFAGLGSLRSRLGCVESFEVAVGYSLLQAGDGEELALRFLQAKPWSIEETSRQDVQGVGSLHQRLPEGKGLASCLLKFEVGQGSIDRWAVNIPYTIVTMQQGTGPVLDDGVPAGDGTGNVDEGILKADDRCAMDWELDRTTTTETGAPYFASPYADLWREAFIEHLLKRVLSKGLTLPFLDYWPEGVEQVAMISHDSDVNLDESAETTLDVLQECGIRSTWCMIEPGYSASIYERVKQDGHELAFHYNALETQDGKWDEAEFDRQFAWMKQATGLNQIVSNKNHYTIFHGWSELFDWCEKHGIQADQTRGPSKKGNIGFLFGTCHPYFPISWHDQRNRRYDVLEISFLTQDLDHRSLADSSVVEPFLEQVKRVRGVAHFLFHQIHIHQQAAVNKAIRKVVSAARHKGFTFWTSAQINEWERVRRKIRIRNGEGEIEAEGTKGTGKVSVWIPVSDPISNAMAGQQQAQILFGVPCVKKIGAIHPHPTCE